MLTLKALADALSNFCLRGIIGWAGAKFQSYNIKLSIMNGIFGR